MKKIIYISMFLLSIFSVNTLFADDTVNITYPALADTTAMQITVSGTLSGTFLAGLSGGTLCIYLNDITQYIDTTVTSGSTTWSGTSSLTGYGNTILVKVFTDTDWMTMYSDSMVVNYFDTPDIEIDTPDINMDTSVNFIMVSGTTANTDTGGVDTVYLYVDGSMMAETYIMSVNGSWSGSVSLNGTGDSILAKLTDQFGRSVYDTILVNYIGEPTLVITYPLTGIDTNVGYCTVAGTSSNTLTGDSVFLIIDNDTVISTVTISAMNGDWSGSVTFNGIGDTVSASVKNKYDIQATDFITVNYRTSAYLSITSPATGYNTDISYCTVSGISYNASTGDSVGLYVGSALMDSYPVSGDSTWQGSVSLTGRGDTITALIGTYEDSVIINYFGIPSVSITYPSDNTDTIIQTSFPVMGISNYTDISDSIQIRAGSTLMSTVSITSLTGEWSGTAVLTNTSGSVTITLVDQFGRMAYDTISINYVEPPAIEITYPVDMDTTLNTITLMGTTDNTQQGDSVSFKVNGSQGGNDVSVDSQGNWTGNVAITDLNQSVVVSITDQYSRMSSDTITVNYYETPTISITSPGAEQDTISNYLTLYGNTANTKDNDSVGLYLDGVLMETVTVSSTNAWSGSVSLNSKDDTIFVFLLDSFGRPASDSVVLNYYGALSAAITSPDSGFDTTGTLITLNGAMSNVRVNDSIILTVDGSGTNTINISAADTVWEGTVILNGTNNAVKLTVNDGFERTVSQTITLNYYATPTVSITTPSDTTTSEDTLTIEGITLNTRANDTIYIYVNSILNDFYVLSAANGTFSGTAALRRGMDDSVAVKLTDQFGRTAWSDSVAVNYLNQAPQIDTFAYTFTPDLIVGDTLYLLTDGINPLMFTIIDTDVDGDSWYRTWYYTMSGDTMIYGKTRDEQSFDTDSAYSLSLNNGTLSKLFSDTLSLTLNLEISDSYDTTYDSYSLFLIKDKTPKIIIDTGLRVFSTNESSETINISFENDLEMYTQALQGKEIQGVFYDTDTFYDTIVLTYNINGGVSTEKSCTSMESYSFTNVFALENGANTITLTAKDSTDNETTLIFVITYIEIVDVKVEKLNIDNDPFSLNLKNGTSTIYLSTSSSTAADAVELGLLLRSAAAGSQIELEIQKPSAAYITDNLSAPSQTGLIKEFSSLSKSVYKFGITLTPIDTAAITYKLGDSLVIPPGYTPSWFKYSTSAQKWVPVESMYDSSNSSVKAELKESAYYGVFMAAIPVNGVAAVQIDTAVPVVVVLTKQLSTVTIIDISTDARRDTITVSIKVGGVTADNYAEFTVSIPDTVTIKSMTQIDKTDLVANSGYFKRTVRDFSITPFDSKKDTVTLTYEVDANAVMQAGDNDLSWFYFDPAAGWTKVESVYDRTAKTVKAEINHFSFYGVFPAVNHAKVMTNLSSLMVYPNPFRPNDGNPETGQDYSPAIQGSGIYINGLVPGTKLKIFTLTGELVDEVVCPQGTGSVIWDAANGSGEYVASGMYILLAQNGSEEVSKKILIIR